MKPPVRPVDPRRSQRERLSQLAVESAERSHEARAMTENQDDEALLRAYVESGDQRVLGQVVENRWAEAHRICLRVLGDPGAAEDAAQEAFVALVRARGRSGEIRSLGAWFQTLVMNAARMAARSRRRR